VPTLIERDNNVPSLAMLAAEAGQAWAAQLMAMTQLEAA
jgi:uncharacterized protein (UPF0276 family)